jgi:hypothetical protein
MNKHNEYLLKMKEIGEKYGNDEEVCHGLADDLLCQILNDLGYNDIVEEFEKLPKWYA